MAPTDSQAIEIELVDSATKFRRNENSYRLDYDPSVDTESVAVIASVAAASQTDPIELPPLYETIDTEALDSLFTENSQGEVAFRYNGFDVTVTDGGTVEIE